MLKPRLIFIAALLSLSLAVPALAKDAIVGAAHKVPSVSAHDRSPIFLHVSEKRARKLDPKQYAKTGRVALLAHGITISSVPDFDLQLPPDGSGLGYSLMDYLAEQGFDVFTVDVQNYGGSDRVPCGLCVTTQVAADDVGAAVDYIRKLRGVERVHLFGWSWGATVAALYASQHAGKVARLVQYAPNVHVDPDFPVPTEEFRKVDVEQCCRDDFVPEFTDEGVFDAYAKQALASGTQAPNGARHDVATKMPLLDPRLITVPTLVIFGALDSSTPIDQPELPAYFRDLATRDKALVIVPEGGHALLMMRSRERLYSETAKWFSLENSSGKAAMTIEQARDFATRYTAAWCGQNPASVAAFFSEQGSLKINDAAPAVGHAALTEAARGFMTAFPDMVVRMDRLDPAGDGFQYRWTLTGTNTGPGGTGNKVHISGYEEWTFGADGLIARSLGHFDPAEYQRQLQQGASE